MDLMLLKKISLLFLLIISASFLSPSFAAGRHSKFVNKLADQEVKASAGTYEEITSKPSHNNEVITIHERLLKVNTKDYGNYNPSPALVKPPFKLIPN